MNGGEFMFNDGMAGAIISVKGEKTHKIIVDSLHILEEALTKSSGIMLQIPHAFFKGINLPFETPEDDYAVAQMFLSNNEEKRAESISKFCHVLDEEKMTLLGFRDVPVNVDYLQDDMPYIVQAFVQKPKNVLRGFDFEKKIYQARKKMEKYCTFASFSSKTIVYKGFVKKNLADFYLDLLDLKVCSSFVLFEGGDGTWESIGPHKYIVSVGKITSLSSNVLKVNARFDDVFNSTGTGMFDDMLEYMHMNKYDIPEALLTLRSINLKKANDFYRFNRQIIEPWEGPGLFIFTDGDVVGGYLDDDSSVNGRYTLTKDGYIYLTPLDVDEFNISAKNRLHPGQIFLVDTQRAQICKHEEIVSAYEQKKPYGEWLNYLVEVAKMEVDDEVEPFSMEINKDIIQMCENVYEKENNDFLDGNISTIGKVNLDVYLGKQGSLFEKEKLKRALLICPIISNKELLQIKALERVNFTMESVETRDIDAAFLQIRGAILKGIDIVILDDERIFDLLPIIQSDLNKNKLRNKITFVLKTQITDTYKLAYLLSEGIDIINPAGAFSIINGLVKKNILKMDYDKAISNYLRAVKNSLSKIVMSFGLHNISSFIGSSMMSLNEKKNNVSPLSVYKLQKACLDNDYSLFLEYSSLFQNELKSTKKELSVKEVEKREVIETYFKAYNDVSYEAKKVIDGVFKQNILVVTADRHNLTMENIKNADEIMIDLQIQGDFIKDVSLDDAKKYRVLPHMPLVFPKTHQDLYGKNDLCQLVYDLKQVCSKRISIKTNDYENIEALVASGVDEIIFSGQKALVNLNKAHLLLLSKKARGRVVLSAMYDFRNANDIIKAAMVGCNNFIFTKAPQIVLGCVLLGDCGSRCVSGVAKGSLNFSGKVSSLETFVHFIAKEVQEKMALLGYHTLEELNGFKIDSSFEVESSLDDRILVPLALNTIKDKNKVFIDVSINYENSVSTKLSGLVGYLDSDTININCIGHAGDSFGAFLNRGITLNLMGDSLDYFGKSMCGGNLCVRLSNKSNLSDEKNIIVGNGCLYGATEGKAYIDGIAGERFAICNSGAKAIVLGMGEYGCAYMRSGCIVCLGDVGANFAYGMTGGMAYIYDEKGDNSSNVCLDFVDVLPIDSDDVKLIMDFIDELIIKTDSRKGKALMKFLSPNRFIKVVPREYKKVNDLLGKYRKEGLSYEEALEKVGKR